MSTPLWQPSPASIEHSTLHAFTQFCSQQVGLTFADHQALHQWSVDQPNIFWALLWQFFDIQGTNHGPALISGRPMLESRFFESAKLNYAQHCLSRRDDHPAIVAHKETGERTELSFNELHQQVRLAANALIHLGLKPGDRMAVLLPNCPEAVVLLLAASSCGVVFASCSPDFGLQGAIDRFEQIEPKLFISCNGYHYNGKPIDITSKAADIANALPNIKAHVQVTYAQDDATAENKTSVVAYEDFLALDPNTDLSFELFDFNHPLMILFSSGTTGKPKCIVHGAGGTLLEHLKELRLHTNVKANDKHFYFTTCGWMMWNWLVSSLACEATIVLFDGSPFASTPSVLWDMAEREQLTHFGTSAKYLAASEKAGVVPKQQHDLSSLRCLMSTGSTLSPESFDYVYQHVKTDVQLSSISGGSDIVGCFALGNPTLPVYKSELQCKSLGLDVHIFDINQQPVIGQQGELVCCQPFPSMPIGFWNDSNNEKYRDAYFSESEYVWHHGDFAEETENGGIIIYGRSDATLNPQGVRIGTAEIYAHVDALPEIQESLAVGYDHDGDTCIVLFVVLTQAQILDEPLIQHIKHTLKTKASPRHVPKWIVQVNDLPRTRSGKLSEIAVRKTLLGQSLNNTEALANPACLAKMASAFQNALKVSPNT